MHDTLPPEHEPLLEIDGHIATVTLNRPDKLNAIDYATADALMRHLDSLEGDSRVRAVILTGAGDKAFSAGADIRGFAPSIEAGAEQALREFVRRGHALTRQIENFPKPVIAAVNGLAYGAGCEIVEACPLAVAADHARFAKPEINLGFPPPWGGTQRLPRHVGRKRALAMILTGQPISAEEAARIGLVNEVAPRSRLQERARAFALAIAEKSPRAVAACLASVTRGLNLPIDEGLQAEAAQFARMAATEDMREGTRAFLERRPARYPAR